MIRIDWVSTEDGGHILTVGLASNIYLYTQVSQVCISGVFQSQKECLVRKITPLKQFSGPSAEEHCCDEGERSEPAKA